MSIKKPDQILPSSPTSTPSPMPLNIPDHALRGESHDQILQNRGIRFLHKKATPCPNINRLDDNSHDPDCQFCDNSAWLYYGENIITGSFMSNGLEKIFERQGFWERGTAMVSMPTEYDDGTEADFNSFDQLIVLDYTIRLSESKEYEPTTGNKQKLRYPIEDIEYLATITGNVKKEFEKGVDFNIVDGMIEWVAGKQPSYNNTTEAGDVFTVSYFAKPVYNVVQTLRELRVTQEMVGGVKNARRLPQQLLVKRDFLPNGTEKIGGP